jgi:hypothetical protein
VHHVPGQGGLQIREGALGVLQEQTQLRDQCFETLLARHLPGSFGQTQLVELGLGNARLDVAQQQHVFDIHQGVDQGHPDHREFVLPPDSS